MEKNSTDNSPIVFGVLPDNIERWKSGFHAEMYRYKCGSYWNVPISLNILHVSTNLNAVSDITKEITNFLKIHGFSSEYISNPKNWSDADILLIGSDDHRFDDAKNMVLNLPAAFGIVAPFDVLFYKLDGMVATGLLPWKPLFSTGPLLRLECTCMVYSSMHKWVDPTTNRGILAAITIEIEKCIDAVMNKNDTREWERKNLYCKIKAFKTYVKSKDQLDANAKLFFAAMNVVRGARNMFVHPLSHRSDGKNNQNFNKFHLAVIEPGRADLCMQWSSDNSRHSIDAAKYAIKLATHAHHWACEYAKRYAKLETC